jgi:hypothetical protein
MPNKLNILIISILFTIGCATALEPTASNVKESLSAPTTDEGIQSSGADTEKSDIVNIQSNPTIVVTSAPQLKLTLSPVATVIPASSPTPSATPTPIPTPTPYIYSIPSSYIEGIYEITGKPLPYDVISGYAKIETSLWKKPHKDYAVQLRNDAIRSGRQSLRFEVRDGDCGADDIWNDCDNDRDRHELSAHKMIDVMSSGTYWFAWSLYLPEDHENLYPVSNAYGQFHQSGGMPVFMFKEKPLGYSLIRTIGEDDYDEVLIIPNDDFIGEWNDVLIYATWSKTDEGMFRVWANGKLKYSYRGPTMTEEDVYFKFGIYRTGVSKYQGDIPDTVVYFDEVRRGSTRQEVTVGIK